MTQPTPCTASRSFPPTAALAALLLSLAAAAPAQEAVFGEGVDISDIDTTQADLFVTGDTVLDGEAFFLQ